MSTKAKLGERIELMLNGGYPSSRKRVGRPEIIEAICSVGATLLKAEVLNNLDGETIPDGAIFTLYEDVPLIRGKNKTTVNLPVVPITLPEKMGLFAIYPAGEPESEFDFIPPGMINLWREDNTLSPLDDNWYTWTGTKATIFRDLVGAGYSAVDMLIADCNLNDLGDDDPLPIPVDLEPALIAGVLQLFGFENKTERMEGAKPE